MKRTVRTGESHWNGLSSDLNVLQWWGMLGIGYAEWGFQVSRQTCADPSALSWRLCPLRQDARSP